MSELSPLRETKTTASQAPIIVNGTAEQLLELWEERIGARPPKDLSAVLPVQLGKHCEPFILAWLERDGHEISERQRYIEHPDLPWISCTLDGYRAFDDAVIEAKTCNPFDDMRDIVTRYAPQALVQLRCRAASRAILAVLRGFSLEQHEVHITAEYERQVWERLGAFQMCVDTLSPPVQLPVLVAPELWRTIDLSVDRPNWATDMIGEMRLWADTRIPARMHEKAKESVKALLPDDVGTVLFGALSVRRAKNGAVTIREKEPAL